jgi:deoxyribodipyrimidine photo-lyase
MIVGSFLTKNLLIPWQEGAAWFWDTLVDADLANNTLGWQWSAGSGADAAPYFRIFNPVLQSAKFDDRAAYIRQWVPELQKLDDKSIHAPWEAKPAALQKVGLVIGKDYPAPIVDLKQSRDRALSAYDAIKGVKG